MVDGGYCSLLGWTSTTVLNEEAWRCTRTDHDVNVEENVEAKGRRVRTTSFQCRRRRSGCRRCLVRQGVEPSAYACWPLLTWPFASLTRAPALRSSFGCCATLISVPGMRASKMGVSCGSAVDPSSVVDWSWGALSSCHLFFVLANILSDLSCTSSQKVATNDG